MGIIKIKPVIIAISGSKNSGKTTLIEGVLPLLEKGGLRIAVIKHHGHKLDPDVPGTDTYRFNHNGAYGTVITDDECFMLVKREQTDENSLMEYFPEADLILLEGYKDSNLPQIEMRRDAATSVCDRNTLIAIVTDGSPPEKDLPVFSYSDLNGIADFIAQLDRFS